MERIKKLRQRYRMSAYALGKVFGVNSSAIIRSEGPGVNCRVNIAYRYAKYFAVSLDYLMGKTDAGFIVSYEENGYVHYVNVTEEQFDALKEMGGLEEAFGEKGLTRKATGKAAEALERKQDVRNYLDPPPTEADYVKKYRMLDQFEQNMVNGLVDGLLMKDGKIKK